MASRGIQGDTLTLGVVVAAGVILWNKFAPKVEGAADKVAKNLELGVNSGGIFQAETTQEINVFQAEVKTWHCDWKALGTRGKTKCLAIANKIYAEAREGSDYLTNLDEDLIINLCRPLSTNELRAVAILFGVKDINNFFGFTVWTGHIFHFFETSFTDTALGGKDLTTIKTIFAKTGFWM
jgi:hypothetical protein